MHWADVEAGDLLSKGGAHLIAAGISPSGFIHVGSLREAMTAEAVRKAVEEKGGEVRMIYLIDSFDPLRKKYPFLPDRYEGEVSKPLNLVPCPCDDHDNYAHHFIQPFLDALHELGVQCDIHWTHELYEESRFEGAISIVLDNQAEVIQILEEVTGREVPEDYFPYTPCCSTCHRFSEVEILGYEHPYVAYRCGCGEEGRADIRKADGKLPWRIEWAAKWKIFGVTCEPFGKDHAAAGGSYDTGVRFARDIFGIEPPHPIPYEFIQLKGEGQMHKSTGTAVTGIEALKMTPAEVLNFIILRYNPDRHIDYDPGIGILDAVDEYDRIERFYFEGGANEKEQDLLRAYELSQPDHLREDLPLQVPYRHLVSVVQIDDDFDAILNILKRTEHIEEVDEEDVEHLRDRVKCVKFWLENFAPDYVKFTVSTGELTMDIDDTQRDFLDRLLPQFSSIEWDGDRIHNTVYECARSVDLKPRRAFQTLYKIFINRESGPRMGYFLSTLERDFVQERLEKAL